jgi:hypothetical protein
MAVCRPLPLQYYRKGAEIESTESTLIALPSGRRESQQHFAPIFTDRPHTADPRLAPPAPQRFIDCIPKELRHRIPTQIPGAKRLVFVAESVGELTDRTLGEHELPQGFL